MSAPDLLRIIPLGGLGEFGLNCSVLECGDDLLVIDAGLMFPTEDFLGVDIVVPDLSYIADRRQHVRAVALTHGHEDHIGAVPFLAPLLDCPIYGAPLTIGFAWDRLRDRGVSPPPHLVPVSDGQTIEAGRFTVQFLAVTHSIPDSVALAIGTPVGTVVHSADFKLDEDPIDGRLTDLERIREYGEAGVRALLLDSTNAPHPGSTPSEREVGRALGRVFREARSRIFITCFSSNIHRLQQIFDLAIAHGRRVALAGRSMTQAAETALALGRLRVPPGRRVEARRSMDLPAERMVVVASGSQGEPQSAMTRIALGDHPDVSIERGDVAVLSSRPIPGNEMAVSRLVDHLYRRGAEVLADREDGLHVSGHARQEELKRMIRLARPRLLLPVHGSYRHLADCARLADCTSAPPEVLIAETGDVIEVGPERARIAGRVPAGRIHIDTAMEEVNEVVLSHRRQLSADGIVLPILVLDRRSGTLASPPAIVSRGYSPLEGRESFQREVAGVVSATIREAGPEATADRTVIKSRVMVDLRRFLRSRTGRRPMILPVIVEV